MLTFVTSKSFCDPAHRTAPAHRAATERFECRAVHLEDYFGYSGWFCSSSYLKRMHLASVRQRNVHLEEENLAAQGKKQVVNTPRRAFGDMKNTGTPGRNSLKSAASAQKPTLQIADANRDRSASLGRNTHKYSQSHPIAALDFDVSEDEPIEGCNLEEDNCFTEKFEQQDSIVLVDPDAENEEEYLQKLMSTSKLSDINEENEEIEFCGPEDNPDNYSYLFNNAETNTLLNEPQPNFYYEAPEDEHTGMARYTLDEMEELFASFNDVLIM